MRRMTGWPRGKGSKARVVGRASSCGALLTSVQPTTVARTAWRRVLRAVSQRTTTGARGQWSNGAGKVGVGESVSSDSPQTGRMLRVRASVQPRRDALRLAAGRRPRPSGGVVLCLRCQRPAHTPWGGCRVRGPPRCRGSPSAFSPAAERTTPAPARVASRPRVRRGGGGHAVPVSE